MNGTKFKLDRDYIYRCIRIPMVKTAMYTQYREEIVMDKKTFIEAFEKWIEKRA